MALEGDVDVLPAIGKTEEREEHFLFSEPYYYYKRVIVTRDTDTEISGIDDLEGLAAAVQRNSSHHSYLLSYPNINLSLYDTVCRSCPYCSSNRGRKAFIGNLATTNYLIRTTGLTDLRFVSFEAESSKPYILLFGKTGLSWSASLIKQWLRFPKVKNLPLTTSGSSGYRYKIMVPLFGYCLLSVH